jgi:hypothetical protein
VCYRFGKLQVNTSELVGWKLVHGCMSLRSRCHPVMVALTDIKNPGADIT